VHEAVHAPHPHAHRAHKHAHLTLKVRQLHGSSGHHSGKSANHRRHYHRQPPRTPHHAKLVKRHLKPRHYLKVLNVGQMPIDVTPNSSMQMQSLLHIATEATAHVHMNKTGTAIQPDTFDPAIQSIRQFMKEQIAGDVQTIVDTLAANAAEVDYCAGNYSYSGSPDTAAYETEESEYSDAEDAHTAAETHENTVCTERDTACTNRDAKGQDLFSEVSPNCPAGNPGLAAEPDDTVAFDDTFLLADVDVYAQAIITKHTAWETAKTTCSEKEVECTEAETATADAYTLVVTECGELESAAVAAAGNYDGCYNTAIGAIQGYAWDDQLTSMKASVEMLETLICYINVAMIGLSAPKGERSKRTDAQLSCEDNAETGMYDCTCSSDDGEMYTEPYDLSVNEPTVGNEDSSWDDKGCAGPPGGDDDDDDGVLLTAKHSHHHHRPDTYFGRKHAQ
jgi:hypothetical protein